MSGGALGVHTEGLVTADGGVGVSLHREGELGVINGTPGRIRQGQQLEGSAGGQAIEQNGLLLGHKVHLGLIKVAISGL